MPIDPVDLHQKIRERLSGLNDPSLPAQRADRRADGDRPAGRVGGRLRWSSPLVDTNMMTPTPTRRGEAIEAMIRHPQSGLRYYQQVSVSDEGPPVMSHGQQVLEAVDQGVAVSAFVYAAVEGRMFYLQFVLTALPPIHPDYRVIDLWPSMSSGKFLGMTLYYSLKTLFKVIAYAPAEIGNGPCSWACANGGWSARTLSTNGSSAGDFGSLMSIRERGTAPQARQLHPMSWTWRSTTRSSSACCWRPCRTTWPRRASTSRPSRAARTASINGDVFNVGSVSGSGIQLGSGNVQRNTASSQSH